MDTSAYLRKQGWRGEGHSLDHTDRGIKKPLLVSKKVDVLGVGLNKHAAVSDQWWLRAFDQGLKNLGTGSGSVLATVQKHGIHRGGLYGRFVKGEGNPGSIGPSVQNSEDNTGANTPTEQPQVENTMPGVIMPEAAFETLAQAPDRKRKYVEDNEGISQKRARVKSGRSDGAEKGLMDAVNRKANALVLEAQRLGIVPLGPNETRKGIRPLEDDGTGMSIQLNDEMRQIVEAAGLSENADFKSLSKSSLKAQKYAREKMKRDLKRAAKAHLLGEKPPRVLTKQEKKEQKKEKKLRKTNRAEEEQQQKHEQRLARKIAEQPQGVDKKSPKRARGGSATNVPKDKIVRKAEKDGLLLVMAEREAAVKAGMTFDEYYALQAVKQAGEATSGIDTGNGEETHEPSEANVDNEDHQARLKAEKHSQAIVTKLRIDVYHASKKGMTLLEYRKARANGEFGEPAIEQRKLSPEKIAEYTKRAAEKKISIEDYTRRRDDKYAAKQGERLGDPLQQALAQAAESKEEAIAAANGKFTSARTKKLAADDSTSALEEAGFIVDTVGDEALAETFATQAIHAITQGQAIHLIDKEGQPFDWDPSMPIPLEPRIWEDVKVKELPKPIRKARQLWMRNRREERKAKSSGVAKKAGEKKSKGQRKIEAREAFVKQLLVKSRSARREGAIGNAPVTIDGVENVPLVKVESKSGAFKKAEISSARTVARRVLRGVKREEKAAKGKGKGWKKRERAAKDAAMSRSINGPTTEARMGQSGIGNPALLA